MCTCYTDLGGSGHHQSSKCLTRVHLDFINIIIPIYYPRRLGRHGLLSPSPIAPHFPSAASYPFSGGDADPSAITSPRCRACIPGIVMVSALCWARMGGKRSGVCGSSCSGGGGGVGVRIVTNTATPAKAPGESAVESARIHPAVRE
jgi:hypothetical protein